MIEEQILVEVNHTLVDTGKAPKKRRTTLIQEDNIKKLLADYDKMTIIEFLVGISANLIQ
jgi:hypothetical protein